MLPSSAWERMKMIGKVQKSGCGCTARANHRRRGKGKKRKEIE